MAESGNGEGKVAILINVKPGPQGMRVEIQHNVGGGWGVVVNLLLAALRLAIIQEVGQGNHAPLVTPVQIDPRRLGPLGLG